ALNKRRLRVDVQRSAAVAAPKLDAAAFGGVAGPLNQRLGVVPWGRSKVDRADALRRRNVDGRGVIVHSDVPTDAGWIEFGVLPGGVALEFVVDGLHLDQKGNHRQIGIDPVTGTGVGCPTVRDGRESVRSLVGVDDLQPGRFADDAMTVSGN